MPAGEIPSSYIHNRYIIQISSITNTKFILWLCVFVFACQISFASGMQLRQQADTIAPVATHHLGRKGFLENYGKDDSSRALINFYFGKRRSTTKIALIGVTLAVVAVLLALITTAVSKTGQSQNETAWDNFFVAVFVVFFAEGSIALLITGAVRSAIYSKRKLLRLLKNYFSGHPIPPGITKSRAFISLIRKEKMKDHINVHDPY